MKPIRAGMLSGVLVGVAAVAISGCAPQLRAVPGPSQGPAEKGKGVFEYRDGITVSVVPVSQPPIGTGGDFVAFGIQAHNTTQATLGIDVQQIRLGLGVGAEWADKDPIPPDDLVQAYQSARVSKSAFQEVTGPELAHYVVHRGYYGGCPPRYYYYGYPYGWPGGYYGYSYYYDGARDAYLLQQETAGFLARLLRSQQVPPGQVVRGFVVFPQTLHKDDDFRLLVPIGLVQGAASLPLASAPATGPAPVGVVFEFHFVAR